MARRNTHLEKYGVSEDKYMELKYFCKQYLEKREKLYSLSEIQGVAYRDMPGGKTIANPTEHQALLRTRLKQDIELIEQTAIEADNSIYQEILKNVTEGIGYFYLDVPCSKKYFYQARDRFFVLLALKK